MQTEYVENAVVIQMPLIFKEILLGKDAISKVLCLSDFGLIFTADVALLRTEEMAISNSNNFIAPWENFNFFRILVIIGTFIKSII